MGQEILTSRFKKQDFEAFETRLREETAALHDWFAVDRFAQASGIGGFELEAWLIDDAGYPLPANEAYLARLANPLVVPELSVFNVEFNTPHLALRGDALSRMHAALQQIWTECYRTAAELGGKLAMIGILPTVRKEDLTVENMSRMVRYRALNEQVLRMRRGKPLQLNIRGRELLRTEHHGVMLEAATTSFQIHLQVPQRDAVSVFNAALLLSAPMVAASANSPFLFGKDLWEETRIPVFEQAVAVVTEEGDAQVTRPRVTFGNDYVHTSLFELFEENLAHYPLLLPMCMDEPLAHLSHLRLHNGTIWRWNRPLIGFDRDGIPHLRIENRVVPAGPSIPDAIANSALLYGLVTAMSRQQPEAATRLSFAQVRENFYTAARTGLEAEIDWIHGKRVLLRQLLLEELLPLARTGLESLGIDRDDIDTYLGIIKARVSTGRTGAGWQRAFAARHGRDLSALTLAYVERQQSGLPVHEWGLTC